jgi:transcription elongation factor Elf1
MLKAVEIQWDFDMDEVYERLDYMKPIEAARFLGVPFDRYERMTTEERHDYAYDVFRHCPGLLDEFMGLPDAITVPDGMTDPEDISDWLSDEYGFCHEGFQLKDVPSHPKPKKILCPSCGKELIELEPYEDNRFNAWCDNCNLSITLNMDEETPVSIDNDKIRVDWYDAGEGLSGDYNPEGPDDIHLLRFDVYKKVGEDWEEVEDASYCTRMPADSNLELLVHGLYIIFKEYNNVLEDDPTASVKKLGEALSWISPEDLTVTYRVYYTVETRYATEVSLLRSENPQQNIEKIKKLAAENFSEADFGEAFNIDGWETLIEDEDGNRIWEK